MQHTTQHTPVVVIGGSRVGLSAALFLASRGIRPIVIERHRGSAAHPRAVGFTARTLELFRTVGIAGDVPEVPAGTRGAELRPGTEMLGFEQDGAGVTVDVRARDSGATYRIRAGYMIAADGADSPTRAALGIGRDGVGYLRTQRSILFRCPQADAILARRVQQFVIVTWPATPRTSCRPRGAGSARTPASSTRGTWRGSSNGC